MPLGNENKLKQDDEDIKYNSLNDSKLIDTDPYSYFSDLIIQISKNITHGRGLSKRGVNALLLFFLTFGLLLSHTSFPQTLIGFFKVYWIPLFFLLYFITDFLRNVSWINEGFMRIFGGRRFSYEAIINDSVNLYELETCLEYTSFSADQLIDIVKHLVNKNQFSPKSQAKLMLNTALYEVKSINYIKDLLLEFEFTSKAVCIFLKKMEMRLDHKYLDKLIEKYCESPSVLFSVGKYHKYKINDQNSLYKLGYEFDYKSKPYDIIMIPVIVINVALLAGFLIIAITYILLFNEGAPHNHLSKINGVALIIGCLFLLFLKILSSLMDLKAKQPKKSISNYLSDKKDLDKNVIENIINDLDFS